MSDTAKMIENLRFAAKSGCVGIGGKYASDIADEIERLSVDLDDANDFIEQICTEVFNPDAPNADYITSVIEEMLRERWDFHALRLKPEEDLGTEAPTPQSKSQEKRFAVQRKNDE